MNLAAAYPWVKQLHIACVLASGALFGARGIGVLAGRAWAQRRLWRGLSVVIDTLLLAAGLSLWWLLQLNPVQNPWLGTKLLLLLVYIGLGSFALRRAPTRGAQSLCYAAALLVYLFIISVAVSHQPAGLFGLLGLFG